MIPVLYRFPDWIPILGDQAITSFSAFLLVALLAAGALFVRLLGRTGGWEIVVAAAIGGLVGAKLVHLGIHGALGLPTGGLGRAGLNWFGGLAGGGAAALWQARRSGFHPSAVAAAAAPALALGYAIGRVGSFLVGADYGVPTTLPWGMRFPAGLPPTTPANLAERFGAVTPPGAVRGDFAAVHPTQLYESVLSVLILLPLLRRVKNVGARGGWRLFGLFLILHGCARAAVELVRAKQDHLIGPVTADMLLALMAVGVGLALRRRERTVPDATEPA